MAKKRSKAISAKISKLVKEGHTRKQAVAMAMSMQRSGRLGPKGGYKRKRKRGKRT